MPEFRYTARNADGESQPGSLEAATEVEARRQLGERGLVDVRIEVASEPAPLPNLSEEQLATRVADAADAGLPLETALRVMAEETSGRDRAALAALCDRLDAGDPPDVAFESVRGLSSHLVGLVRAGTRTGELGEVLGQYVERRRDRADRRGRLAASLAYPVILFGCSVGIVLFLLVVVVPGFEKILTGFGTELPWLTELVIGSSDFAFAHPLLLLVLAAGLVGGVLLLGLVPFGPASLHRLLQAVPVLGTAIRSDRLAAFCDLLGLIVSQRVPLPEALRLTADGLRDPLLSPVARRMAADVEKGRPPVRRDRSSPLPEGVRTAFTWQDDESALGDALLAAGRVYDAQARTNADLLRALVGPLAIILVATSVGTILIALFLPLIKLLNDLS